MASHAHTVPFGSHLALREVAMNTAPPTILPRDANGLSKQPYKVTADEKGHVTSAINLCRLMLCNEKVREVFVRLAGKYRASRPNTWSLQGPNRMSPEKVSYTFIQKVYATFPRVFVDYALTNPDRWAFHTRRPWDGDFEPRHQAISISGQMVDHMLAAINKNDHSLFRAFLFKTANGFLHEIGHVFVTFLAKDQDREMTPPQINALTVSAPQTDEPGEAGLFLEYYIFGGTLGYYHDRNSGTEEDGECGTAYLKKSTGSLYRITRDTIDDTASATFKFPYRHRTESVEPGKMESLGQGRSPSSYTDPLAENKVAYLLKSPAANY